MNISEMHVWFRQYAQQMGMQNTRAILPEQIDLLINTSIADTINQVIARNVSLTNDRVITDNSKIDQINALSTLHKVIDVNCAVTNNSIFQKGEETSINRIYANIENFVKPKFDYLYLLDVSIAYEINKEDKNIITNYFPIRLVDDSYLEDAINDEILKPQLRSPIGVIYDNNIDIYLQLVRTNNTLINKINPYKIKVKYIAKPAIVQYASDIGGYNIDCNLPEHMHVNILKHAVDLYRITISGALNAERQSEQAQQPQQREYQPRQ